jgi:predicted outer membrane protein
MKARSLFVAIALCAPAVAADPPPPLDDTATRIVTYLHAVDQLEIDVGKLAQSHGTASMRVFGATLVADHTATDRDLVAYARRHGMRSIPTDAPIDPDHRPVADAQARLKTLRGNDFDAAFLDVMPAAEDAEAATIEDAIASVQDPELEQILRNTEPQLKSHVTAINSLKSTH